MPVFKLNDQEVADLIQALEDAQNELCADLSDECRFPEGTGYWNRWQALILRFRDGATARLRVTPNP